VEPEAARKEDEAEEEGREEVMPAKRVLRKLKYVNPETGSLVYTTLRAVGRVGKTREQWKRQKKRWNVLSIDPDRPLGWVPPPLQPLPAPVPEPPAEPKPPSEG